MYLEIYYKNTSQSSCKIFLFQGSNFQHYIVSVLERNAKIRLSCMHVIKLGCTSYFQLLLVFKDLEQEADVYWNYYFLNIVVRDFYLRAKI